MTQTHTSPEENWRKLVEVFNLSTQPESHDDHYEDQDVGSDQVDLGLTKVHHRGKFPNRLRVTTIAE